MAARLVEISGIERGISSVLGGGDLDLALELARSGFLVSLIDPRNSIVEAGKKSADESGLYGKSIIVEKGTFKKLPYADNTVDLIFAAHLTGRDLAELPCSEILRVLRPGGKAVIVSPKGAPGSAGTLSAGELNTWIKGFAPGTCRTVDDNAGLWAVATKPPLDGTDNWSHWEHGPDNNPVSVDKAISAPYMTHFLGLPYYIAMPAITTAAGGRIFTAMGHIAHHKREEQWLNTVLAQNGYNGTELWRRKLPDGYLVHRSAFIATDSAFYMIDPTGSGCLVLDPETGEEKERIHFAEKIEGEWKWMVLDNGILFALAGPQKDPSETTIVRSPANHWSWDELSSGYYEKRIPWGFGKTILAYDLTRKKLLWTHNEEKVIDSRAMALGDGKVYFYCPDSRIGCLAANTGELLWANPDPEIRKLIEEPGRGLTSTPGFRTTCFCLYTPKALFYQAQTNQNVVAVSLKDGSLLWHKPKITSNPNLLYADNRLIAGIGPEGSHLALDPLTGATIEDLGFRKRSCARLTATWDSYFCRSQFEGLVRYDRLAKKVLFNGAMRPACNDGVIGANGLLYIGPWLCDCNLSLMGRQVLCSANGFQFERLATESENLEKGAGDITRIAAFDISDKDWPTYRANNSRSASSGATVPGQAEKAWLFDPPATFKPTAPTAAGGLVFIGGDDCKVRAIDAATGKLRWTFLTGGPIIEPPAIWQGRAYVGSGDGYVYALEAATGRLLWRFRAAPVERRIMVYGSLCSTWPVASGVLVQDGVAYAAAGIIDYDGTYVYALDAVTGRIKWQNTSSGHLDKTLRKGISVQGMLTIASSRLWMPGGNVISPASFDLATGKYLGLGPVNGSPQANRGEEIGILNGRWLILGGKLRYSTTENVVNPAYFSASAFDKEGNLGKGKSFCVGRIPPAWNESRFLAVNSRYKMPWELEAALIEPGQHQTPVCYPVQAVEEYFAGGSLKRESGWQTGNLDGVEVVSLALARNAALAVSETWVLRDRNSDWAVHALSLENGSLIWEEKLPSPALAGGLLIDREGRVVVVCANGTVACFKAKGAS
jgi:outer membrane protein assembly factor BamB